MDCKPIGKKIRERRLELGLRQDEVAAQTGLTANYIGMIERGEKQPSLESMVQIANALKTTLNPLMADVLDTGNAIKASLLAQKLEQLPSEDLAMIFDIIDCIQKHKTKAD